MTTATIRDVLTAPASGTNVPLYGKLTVHATDDPENEANIGYLSVGGQGVGHQQTVPYELVTDAEDDDYGKYRAEWTGVAPNNPEAVAAPSIRGVWSAGTANPATTGLTVDLTSTAHSSQPPQAGDILILFVGDVSSTDTVDTPSGWTALGDDEVTHTDLDCRLFKKTAVGGETSVVLNKTTPDSSTDNVYRATVVAVAGATLGVDDWATESTGSNDSTAVVPSVDLTAANELAVALVMTRGFDNELSGWTDNYTEILDAGTDGLIGTLGCGVAYKVFTSSGSTSTVSVTLETAAGWVAAHLSFRPADSNPDAIVSPEGTYYGVETQWKGHTDPERLIEVPDGAGPYYVQECLIADPDALTSASVAPSSAAFVTAGDPPGTLPNAVAFGEAVKWVAEGSLPEEGDFDGQLVQEGALQAWVWKDNAWSTFGGPADASGSTFDSDALIQTAESNVQDLGEFLTGMLGVGAANAGAALRQWRYAYGNRLANVWVVGDSVSVGHKTDTRPHIWHNYTMDAIARSMGVPTNPYRHMRPGEGYLDTATVGGTAVDTCGIGRVATTLTGSQTITYSGVVCDRVILEYVKQSGGGTVSLQIDSDTAVTASTSGTARGGYFLDSGAKTLGSHSITISVSGGSGTVTVGGVLAFTGDYSNLRCLNASESNAGLARMIDTTTTLANLATGIDGMEDSTFEPDLVLIEIGSNNLSPVETESAILEQYLDLIDAITAKCTNDPSIVIIPPVQNSYATDAGWLGLQRAGWQAMALRSCAVLDLRQALGSDATGDMHTGSSDTVHPGPFGHQLIGETVARFLLTAAGTGPGTIHGGTP